MIKKLFLFSLVIIAAFLFASDLFAQCAMCRATAESDLKSGGSIGKGLNSGILYLLFIPYILMAGLAFIFFRKQITEKFKAIKSRFLSI